MKRPLILMFSGQGSQYFQMGKELYEQNGVFRDVVEQGELIVRRRLGRSLSAELYGRGRGEIFDELALSHPALITIEFALYRTLVSEGIVFDQVWGTSLGEYVAAIVAGIWSFESALEAVMEQARLATACPAGGMLAILEHVDLYAELRNAGHDITLAGINFKKHFTIAADVKTLAQTESILKARGIACQSLPVRYAFHSAAIDGLREAFTRFCASLPVTTAPNLRFVSSMSGAYLDHIAPDHFWQVVRSPMRFGEAAVHLAQLAASDFVDGGPSGTAATFVKYNLAPDSQSAAFPILTPFHQGVQKIEQLKRHLALLH